MASKTKDKAKNIGNSNVQIDDNNYEDFVISPSEAASHVYDGETYVRYLKLILDQKMVDAFNKYYMITHSKAKKIPINRPIHPSLNVWTGQNRIAKNDLKQKWKDMTVRWIKMLGYTDLQLESFDMVMTTYMPSRRRVDCDNLSPKFICDGFTEAGFIVDDDYKHLHSLTLRAGYDKDNPRTEFEFYIYDKDNQKLNELAENAKKDINIHQSHKKAK